MESLAFLRLRARESLLVWIRRARAAWSEVVEHRVDEESWTEYYVGTIVCDSVERALNHESIYLSDHNRGKLYRRSAIESHTHPYTAKLEPKLPPKRPVQSAGLRGAGIAILCNLIAVLLLLFMERTATRDAVVAAACFLGLIGAIVAWIGRRRARHRIG